MGAITAIGNSPSAVFEAALSGRSGVRPAPELAVGPLIPLVASAVFDPETVILRQRSAPMDRATAMAVAAARQAVTDAGADIAPGSPLTGARESTVEPSP